MAIAVQHLMFDATDYGQAKMLAEFWSAAMGTAITVANGTVQVSVPIAGQMHAVYSDGFAAETPVTSRMHVVFTPSDGPLSEEVDRLFALGATLVDDRRRRGFHGAGWVILADPAGNEFRVQSNDDEVAEVEGKRAK